MLTLPQALDSLQFQAQGQTVPAAGLSSLVAGTDPRESAWVQIQPCHLRAAGLQTYEATSVPSFQIEKGNSAKCGMSELYKVLN